MLQSRGRGQGEPKPWLSCRDTGWGWGNATRHHQDLSQAPLALLTCSLSLQFTVAFQDKEFKVTLPDGHVLTFPNRLGHNHLPYLSMDGLHISSFKLE